MTKLTPQLIYHFAPRRPAERGRFRILPNYSGVTYSALLSQMFHRHADRDKAGRYLTPIASGFLTLSLSPEIMVECDGDGSYIHVLQVRDTMRAEPEACIGYYVVRIEMRHSYGSHYYTLIMDRVGRNTYAPLLMEAVTNDERGLCLDEGDLNATIDTFVAEIQGDLDVT